MLQNRQLAAIMFTDIIMSPSLWWNNESSLKEAPALLQSKDYNNITVYIGACKKEEDELMYEDAVTLTTLLKKYGSKKIKVFYDYLLDEIHSTMMHQSVYNAFKLIYPHTEYQK